jgi:hypothetical protein
MFTCGLGLLLTIDAAHKASYCGDVASDLPEDCSEVTGFSSVNCRKSASSDKRGHRHAAGGAENWHDVAKACTAMNRRDFLLFRTEGRTTTVELSCERLYMRYVDARRAPEPDAPDAIVDGEPPARFDRRSVRQLFDDIANDVRNADLLRITQTEWLSEEDFRREVMALVDGVRARNGRVEMS